ncbi:hypothetical protein [Sphingomonas sp. PB1R3]|uniref:hypothetical protein n=1 Tax=Sphingomonas flavida TaxID=3096154 RepID=UPI002FC69B45
MWFAQRRGGRRDVEPGRTAGLRIASGMVFRSQRQDACAADPSLRPPRLCAQKNLAALREQSTPSF